MAKIQPMRLVFCDDSAKINVEQIFKHLRPAT